jgi:hypothetical protein
VRSPGTFDHRGRAGKGWPPGSTVLARESREDGELDSASSEAAKDEAREEELLRDLKEVLTKAIDTLPEREKQLIALYYYEDLTMREISEIFRLGARICQLLAAVLRLRGKTQHPLEDNGRDGPFIPRQSSPASQGADPRRNLSTSLTDSMYFAWALSRCLPKDPVVVREPLEILPTLRRPGSASSVRSGTPEGERQRRR